MGPSLPHRWRISFMVRRRTPSRLAGGWWLRAAAGADSTIDQRKRAETARALVRSQQGRRDRDERDGCVIAGDKVDFRIQSLTFSCPRGRKSDRAITECGRLTGPEATVWYTAGLASGLGCRLLLRCSGQ